MDMVPIYSALLAVHARAIKETPYFHITTYMYLILHDIIFPETNLLYAGSSKRYTWRTSLLNQDSGAISVHSLTLL